MSVTVSTARLFLDDPTAAWIVEAGEVDIFLVDVEHDGAPGPLFHVCTLSSGEVFCGVGTLTHDTASTTLVCHLRSAASVSAVFVSTELTNRWRTTLLSAEPLLDASILDGSILEITADSNARLLKLLFDRRAAAEQSEAQRIERKHRVRSAAMQRALSLLISPLKKEKAPVHAAVAQSAIFAACIAVGIDCGIEMSAPRNFVPSEDLIRDAQSIARATNVRYRQVSIGGEWWKEDHGPLLGFRTSASQDSLRPIALLRRRRAYVVYDPADHSTTPVTAASARDIAPAATLFYRPFPARPITWKDLLSFALFNNRREGLVILLAGAAMGLLALVAPIATGILFDTIIPGAQRSQLLHMGVLLLTANIVAFLVSLTSSAATLRMEGRMEAAIQSAVWDRLLSLPARFFREYNSGDLVTRSLAIGQIRKQLTGAVLGTLLSSVFSVFSFLLLFYYSAKLAWVAAALTLFTALLSLGCSWLQMRYMRQIYDVSSKLSGLVLQIMTGISKLRMSGTESHAFAHWAEGFSKQNEIVRKSQRISIVAAVFNGAFPSVAAIAIYYFGFSMMQGDAGLSPGSFVAFNASFGQFLGAALGLSGVLISTIGIIPAYEQALPIMQAVPEARVGRIDPGALNGDIEVNRLTFRYNPDLPLAINDLSFRILPGQFVAFVGQSGSGKSTLFRLLLGFEVAESGMIHFDGVDLRDIDPTSLRRQMGVVLQNGRIFDGDIFTNIVGSAPFTVQDAWAAARAAGLDRDIEAMPMGMHTVISEGGGGFSGGQRQRLLIARAIVHKPRILLFDEATSALDNQTQAIVSRSLDELKATRIVIAHRLSTVMNADQIFVFDQGRIIQRGTYQELLAEQGPFRQLAERQLA